MRFWRSRDLSWQLGYGWDRLPAKSRQLTGLFAAVQLQATSHAALSAEYDAKKFSLACRGSWFNHFEVMVGVWDFRHACGAVNFYFSPAEL